MLCKAGEGARKCLQRLVPTVKTITNARKVNTSHEQGVEAARKHEKQKIVARIPNERERNSLIISLLIIWSSPFCPPIKWSLFSRLVKWPSLGPSVKWSPFRPLGKCSIYSSNKIASVQSSCKMFSSLFSKKKKNQYNSLFCPLIKMFSILFSKKISNKMFPFLFSKKKNILQ